MRCKETEYRDDNMQSHVLSPQMYEDRLQEVSVYARGMVRNNNVSRTDGQITEPMGTRYHKGTYPEGDVYKRTATSVVLRIVVNLP